MRSRFYGFLFLWSRAMDFVDCECQLLYKQNLETWFKERNRTKKFADEDLKLVQILQQKFKFKYDEDEEYDYRDKTYLNGRFGHVFYTEPDPVLFSFTEVDGTVTLYKRSLEDHKTQTGTENEELSGNKKAESTECATRSTVLQRIFVDHILMGSKYGGKMLAYSSKGHILLIDLDTRIGNVAAIWPLDSRLLESGGGCCGLMSYDPDIKAAVSGDFSLVAATGPSVKEEEVDNEEEEIQIRIFNLNTKECSLKTLKLGGDLTHHDIQMISFNPCHPDMLYISLYIASKSKFLSRKQAAGGEASNTNDDDDNDDGDDDDDDDDDDEDILLILYNLSTEQVLAEIFGISLIPLCDSFVNNTVDVTFLKHGTMSVAYKPVSFSSTKAVFLDAFSLEIIGIVNMTGIYAVLGNHVLISSCKSQFAIFKCKNLDSSNELKYDVEVYKVPDNDLSLKNFCRKVILDRVDMNHVDNLSLPNVLKNYLKL